MQYTSYIITFPCSKETYLLVFLQDDLNLKTEKTQEQTVLNSLVVLGTAVVPERCYNNVSIRHPAGEHTRWHQSKYGGLVIIIFVIFFMCR